MLKALNLTLAIILYNSCCFAQNFEKIVVKGSDLNSFYEKSQYKYPSFKTGDIYFNNGETARAKLNFNYFDQSLRFLNEKGDTVVLANETDVNLIKIGTDTFFYDNGFYEWVASSAKGRLAAKHIYKLADSKRLGAFGTTPATGVEPTDQLINYSNYRLKIANLTPNEEFVFSKITTYYISTIKGTQNNFIVVNKRNLDDLFPKKDVADFIKDNKLNLNKEEDLINVFIHVSK